MENEENEIQVEEAVEERLRRPIDIGRRPRPKLTIARDIRDDAVAQADIDIRFDERLVPDRLVEAREVNRQTKGVAWEYGVALNRGAVAIDIAMLEANIHAEIVAAFEGERRADDQVA